MNLGLWIFPFHVDPNLPRPPQKLSGRGLDYNQNSIAIQWNLISLD